MVRKLKHPVIFGMSWFAEFHPQIDWQNRFISLDLDAEQYTVIATCAADLFSGIDLCNSA